MSQAVSCTSAPRRNTPHAGREERQLRAVVSIGAGVHAWTSPKRKQTKPQARGSPVLAVQAALPLVLTYTPVFEKVGV